MVEVGNEFFHELVSRSFFQQSNGKSRPVFQGSNGDPLFVMHDLINDLARYVSREFCFRVEGEDSNKISERTRHLSYAVTRHDACERFQGIYDAKLLRTFLPLSEAWLRNQINVLPVSRVWPRNEIDNKTLILENCKELVELPDSVGHLKHLLYASLKGKDTGSSIQELGKLKHLQGGLNIWNLQNVGTAPDALQDNVKGMKHLKTLNLMWDGDPNDSGHVRHVLDKLEPDVNMEYLYIYGYGGTRFSDWVGDSSFSRIVSMELSRCKYCTSLPPLGQLGSLKELMVRGFEGLAIVGREFYGSCTSVRKPFASLESLTLSMMPEWREWISDHGMQAFPCLQKLCISGCPLPKKGYCPITAFHL
ncbi:hypothetical protein OIU78_021400 [Salix suchowensis]|nr:hypothetical protein OIU78_021400 [Salix suchowensis]